jgi:hypothetical protein
MVQDFKNPVIPQEIGMLHWIGHAPPFVMGNLNFSLFQLSKHGKNSASL